MRFGQWRSLIFYSSRQFVVRRPVKEISMVGLSGVLIIKKEYTVHHYEYRYFAITGCIGNPNPQLKK